MIDIIIKSLSIKDHFKSYYGYYNGVYKRSLLQIDPNGDMFDFTSNLKHFGYVGNLIAYDDFMTSFDDIFYKEIYESLIEFGDTFVFEFPDEETALYFVLKFTPEIINEEDCRSSF